MRFQPRDMIVWLSLVDVNGLSAAQAEKLASLNIESDSDLSKIVGDWIRPMFNEYDAQNQREMLLILEQSKQWTESQLKPVFDEVGIPSGQEIENINRFMEELRAQMLV